LTTEIAKLKLGYAGRGCRGCLVKARRLIASGSYDPDQLKALGKGFDDAWARIAPTVSNRAKAIDTARLQLADIVLSLAKSGNFDPQWLADRAVQVMLSRSSGSQP
jgi:hypothetical protein